MGVARRSSETGPKTPPEVTAKIKHLIEEGKTPKEAAGAAYGMYREGRLTKSGEYKRRAK